MKYLICQDWRNTSNNHAGIKYLCNKMEEMYPSECTCYTIPFLIPFKKSAVKNAILKKVQLHVAKIRHKIYVYKIYQKLKQEIQPGDKIIIMEYMEKMFPMLWFAKKIKRNNPQIAVYGMVHLVPSKLEKAFGDTKFIEWTSYVNKIITLGSSLTDYFIKKGVNKDCIITSFHYVDRYYFNDDINYSDKPLTIIAMGMQMRNIGLLKTLVKNNKSLKFIICEGLSDLSHDFGEYTNVQLIPFVAENKLRELMSIADISINVMEDTIGSNVIVTSLAMGLAMVNSNVGSIHDYCSDDNSFFCLSETDFSNAIETLDKNRDMLYSMKLASRKTANKFTIEKFYKDLNIKL